MIIEINSRAIKYCPWVYGGKKECFTRMGPPAPPWHNWGSSILHKRRSPVGTPELSGPRHSPEKARRRWLAPTSSILLKVEEITQIQYSELLCSMWKISMATVRKLSYNSKCLTYVIKSPVSSKWASHTIPGPLIPPFLKNHPEVVLFR